MSFFRKFCVNNNIAIHMDTFSNIKTLSTFSSSEGNNDLFITGYNSMLLNDNTRAARDFYLLLMIYVNYFCLPVLSFFLNGFSSFMNSILSKSSEGVCFAYKAIAFFVKDKDYISKLSLLQKGQVEFNSLSRNLYCKTVLH